MTQLEKVSLQLLAKALCHSLISSCLGTPEGASAMAQDSCEHFPKGQRLLDESSLGGYKALWFPKLGTIRSSVPFLRSGGTPLYHFPSGEALSWSAASTAPCPVRVTAQWAPEATNLCL